MIRQKIQLEQKFTFCKNYELQTIGKINIEWVASASETVNTNYDDMAMEVF